MRSFFLGIAALGLGGLRAVPAVAEPVRTPHVTAELVVENDHLQPDGGGLDETANRVAVRLEMAPHWHTYWRFPGDSGLPTEFIWDLPKGWSVSEARWPLPQRIPVPPLVNYGYEGTALIGFTLRVPAGVTGEFPVKVKASWLVCKEECIPEKGELTARVRVGAEPGRAGPLAGAFRQLWSRQPRRVPPDFLGIETQLRDKLVGISLRDKAEAGPRGSQAEAQRSFDFFPLAPMIVKGDAPPTSQREGDRLTLWMEKSDPYEAKATSLPGVLVELWGGRARNVYEIQAPLPASGAAAAEPAAAPAENGSPLLLVLFALLGGLILNLMPCVFPVLGIKVMALVRQGGDDGGHARRHGLLYAAGVVASFWALAGGLLALRSAGQAVGWGFQLQQPMFVTALILLFSFVAADLAGFVTWSGRWMGVGSELAGRDGPAGSFFTGVLAVVVATPCTAPFMGTAIGAAIGEPGWVLCAVFTALGVGLALPFVVLCYQPAFLRALPKPGAWMERLKELFAFPMAATVLWLFWVLAQQVGADGTLKVQLGLVLLVASLWLRRRWSGLMALAWANALVVAGVAVCALGAASAREGAGAAAGGAWKPYSEAALTEALAAKKSVFVDFTAAWCLTCQVNKKLVLDRAPMQEYLRAKGVVLLLADWTNRDPEITRALEKQGRIGVPLYLAYRNGEARPEVLPQILTEDRLHSTFP